jgi:hypothetical protein
LQLLAVASVARLMAVLVGRWAVMATWLFFVVLATARVAGL